MALERHLRLVEPAYGTKGGWMATALKVAFASTDRQCVDQHFGSAAAFVIYAFGRDQWQLLEVAQFGELAQDGNEDKLSAKLDALEGCVAVYSQAVGASAVAQLKARGIQPMKVAPGTRIATLLSELQHELDAGPASWIARAIAHQNPADPRRFDAMEAEGWDE